MTTAAQVSARVEALAASLRASATRPRPLRLVAPPVGPRRAVLSYGEKADLLECGHTVRAQPNAYARRVCPFCPKG